MIYVCDSCCRPCIGNADERKRVFRCTTCSNTDPEKMSIIELPYAGKLLVQEVMGLRVGVDLVTENALRIRAGSPGPAGPSATTTGAGAGAGAGAGSALYEFEM